MAEENCVTCTGPYQNRGTRLLSERRAQHGRLLRTQDEVDEMDLADASLYWLAAETGLTEILTVDVSDFSRYRLPRGKAFTLL